MCEYHSSMKLEITESVLLGNDLATISKLQALVDYGFDIAIDDFGTGYSNLSYLHRYPISCLKIDRSFIAQIETAQPIIELIISMARLFDLDVVAEGVETSAQLQALKAYDCQESIRGSSMPELLRPVNSRHCSIVTGRVRQSPRSVVLGKYLPVTGRSA